MTETEWPTLDEIATRCGTDKATSGHAYTTDYDQLFTPKRFKPIVLLELGWGRGRSAIMWQQYFPNANAITYIDDVFLEWVHPIRGIHRYQGDQTDPELIQQAARNHAGFDIIIDDASHIQTKTLTSHKLLWPHLRPGGYYAIEDADAAHDIQGLQNLPPETLNNPDAQLVINRPDLLIARKTH
jgi:cephalosporin hydroxylase